MGPAKNLGHFNRCTLTILLLTMSSTCSASVSMVTDATFLTVPALGRTSQLGFLYDERTDTIRPVTIFSRQIPADVVIETENRDVATVAQQVTKSYDEKIQLLEIGLNAALNIMVGNTKVRGTSSILKEETENSLVQQGTLLRTYHTVDESLQVFYDELRPFYNKYLFQHKDATHIVSGISWGSRISVTLQAAAATAQVIDSEDLSDVFYDEFQILKRGGSLTSDKIGENVNFTIDVKSDIPLPGPTPTTLKDVEILLNQMPQLIKDSIGGKGVPLEFTLTPLSELRSHLEVQTIINNPVHKIKESTLRRLVNTFDDILNSEQRLNDLYQKTYFQLNCLGLETRDEIADLRTGFLKYKKSLADSVKETLVAVRSGSTPASALTEIAEEFKQSNFSSRRLKNKIREYDDVIEKVEFCEMIQTSYSEIEYFGSRQNLIPRISENSQRAIYILFIKTEFKNSNPLKYNADLNTFLTKLYTAPSTKLFIVDCDGGGHVSCISLNQTEIHEYKNGRLTSRNLGGHHDEEVVRNMEKRLIELENNITILHNLTAYLLKQHTEEGPIRDSCKSSPCQNNGLCHSGVNFFNCTCPEEFAGDHCEIVNECQYPGTCAPPNGAGNCHRCRDGFVKDPEDDTRCKYANGNASLIISSEKEIIKMSLDGKNATQMIQSKELARGTDYNFRTNTIFWSTLSDTNIYAAPINTESVKTSILHNALSAVYGIAVDWIHQHLYWVDDGRDQLCVSNFNGTMKKVLFNDGFSSPSSIAVNPLSGWMYWSDEKNNRIERAGLDGSRREVILSTNITKAYGLLVDFVDNRLYWSQGQNPSSIWSSDFDGSSPKLIFSPNPSQFASSIFWKIALLDKYVYFIEWNSKTIYRVNKCNGGDLEMMYKSDSNLREIKIFDVTLQPEGENVCSKRTEQCSHFCFPVPVPSSGNGSVSMTTCACPDGLSLSADQQSCV